MREHTSQELEFYLKKSEIERGCLSDQVLAATRPLVWVEKIDEEWVLCYDSQFSGYAQLPEGVIEISWLDMMKRRVVEVMNKEEREGIENRMNVSISVIYAYEKKENGSIVLYCDWGDYIIGFDGYLY